MSSVYILIKPIESIYNMKKENRNQNIKPESKMKIENEIPNPLSISDNRLAIRMLNSVSEIISEIKRDDKDMIELNLNELKTRLSQFEKVFYNNKQKGVYR